MNENLRSCMTSDRGPCKPLVVNCCSVFVTALVRFWTAVSFAASDRMFRMLTANRKATPMRPANICANKRVWRAPSC